MTAPFFECSDADITTTYHYRLRYYGFISKSTPFGHVLTEFLYAVQVVWSAATHQCAYGHPAADARWLRDIGILDNYSSFWFVHPKADRRYTWWPSRAAIRRFHSTAPPRGSAQSLSTFESQYSRWIAWSKAAQHDCLWQACHDDGEENSIGLDGCRPSINAAMAGEAAALATMASLLRKAVNN